MSARTPLSQRFRNSRTRLDEKARPHEPLVDNNTRQGWRQYYEERHSRKQAGDLQRLHVFHVADNLALSRRINRRLGEEREVLVDVGAGTSITSFALRVRTRFRMDLAVSALTWTTKRDDGASSIQICASATELPLRSGAADVVTICQVLEHLPDYKASIGECARVLSRGGLFVATVPNSYRAMAIHYHSVSRDIDNAGHLRVYDRKTLCDEIAAASVDVVDMRTTGYRLFAACMRLERTAGVTLMRNLNKLTNRRAVAHILSTLLMLENALHGRSSNGMSFEIYGIRR